MTDFCRGYRCSTTRAPKHLFCRECWHSLPIALRDRVFTDLRVWRKTRSPDARIAYVASIRAARDATRERYEAQGEAFNARISARMNAPHVAR